MIENPLLIDGRKASTPEQLLSSCEAAYQGLALAFERAVETCPNAFSKSFYMFADRLACIRVVGRRLAEHINRPFAHLRLSEIPPAQPQLIVDLWDEATAKVSCESCEARENQTLPARVTASLDGHFVVQERARTKI